MQSCGFLISVSAWSDCVVMLKLYDTLCPVECFQAQQVGRHIAIILKATADQATACE